MDIHDLINQQFNKSTKLVAGTDLYFKTKELENKKERQTNKQNEKIAKYIAFYYIV